MIRFQSGHFTNYGRPDVLVSYFDRVASAGVHWVYIIALHPNGDHKLDASGLSYICVIIRHIGSRFDLRSGFEKKNLPERKERFRLSVAQERQWMLHKIRNNSIRFFRVHYNESGMLMTHMSFEDHQYIENTTLSEFCFAPLAVGGYFLEEVNFGFPFFPMPVMENLPDWICQLKRGDKVVVGSSKESNCYTVLKSVPERHSSQRKYGYWFCNCNSRRQMFLSRMATDSLVEMSYE